MRAQSPGNDRPATAAAIVRAAVVVSGMVLGATVGVSGATALNQITIRTHMNGRVEVITPVAWQ